ncbi:MAG: hypothetical protein GXP06_09725 [Alphaproteobacteria bacterium]|nr:hypothetical protein [Alphaproteobacteria bacterium]
MKSILKAIIALIMGAGVYGFAQTAAAHQPDSCAINHDHRSHNASYYDYYPKDNYYRAGPYRSKSRGHHNSRYGNGRGYDRRQSHRARSRVVNRETYRTRWNARITLVEEVYWTRSGRRQLVCSVVVRGYDAHQVPHRRLKRIAHRDCSPRARIQYL